MAVQKKKKTPKAPAKSNKSLSKAKPIPDNYPPVNAVLGIKGAADTVKYYERVFDAKQRLRLDMPGGRVGHAELKIGKGLIMLSDEFPETNILGPNTIGGTAVVIQLYVKDTDATMKRAEKAGGKVLRPAKDEFYGDRSRMIEDPFGHVWIIQTHIEDVSPAQMKRRLAEMLKSP
jgi:PhnB protein